MKKQLFKFLLCLTAVIFAVSCGGNNDSPTSPNIGTFSVYRVNKEFRIGVDTDNSTVKTSGRIQLSTSYEAKVEINNVTTSGTVQLAPSDFTLSQDTILVPYSLATADYITISLSASGIEKIKKAEKAKSVKYTLTFLFTRISDNQTYTLDEEFQIANLQIITKTDIETAMREVKDSYDSSSPIGTLNVGTSAIESKWKFDLSGFTLNQNQPYEATVSGTVNNVKDVSDGESAITLQTYKEGRGFSLSPIGKRDSNTQATFTIKALVFDGYTLDNSISYVQTDGFKLVLKLGTTTGGWK